LLRSENPSPPTAGGPAKADGDPLFQAETNKEYNDADRSAFFRFQPITRLANLTTTRSNVYAVWVTIGFFEVESAPAWSSLTPAQQTAQFGASTGVGQAMYNRVYPSGYMLGKEDGVETGNIRRMRSFYIIDRTLPAAFEPGVDHNVENVIRLRRRIE
jgi:hypothetical protein